MLSTNQPENEKLDDLENDVEITRTSIEELKEQMEQYSQTLRDMPSKASIIAILNENVASLREDIENQMLTQNSEIEQSSVTIKNIESNSVIKKIMKDMKELRVQVDESEGKEVSFEANEEQKEVILKILHQCIEELRVEFQKHNKIQDDKISNLEVKVANLEFSTGEHVSEQQIEDLRVQISDLEDVWSEEKVEHILGRVASLEQSNSSVQIAPVSSGMQNSNFEDFKDEINTKFNELDERLKLEHDKALSKIDEIKTNVDKADQEIKVSINDFKTLAGRELEIVLKEIKNIKNEMVEDSTKLKDKFEEINEQEDVKHDAVLIEIANLKTLLSNQEELINKSKESQNSQMIMAAPIADSSEVEFKLENLKEEITKQITEFKEELNKDKDFERDRILNCVQDINENKKLIDTKISEYEKAHQENESKDYVTTSEVENIFISYQQELDSTKVKVDSYYEEFKKSGEKIHEIELKYGRVARQANEIEERVVTIESEANNQLDKPLQIKNVKQSVLATDIFGSSKQEKQQLSDMFNDFTGKVSYFNKYRTRRFQG